MPKIETYTANLSREGSTGSVRGKIPATLISAMGGDDGDVFEFQVNGKTLVGGRIITGKEARSLRAQGRQNFGSAAPVAKAQPVKAPVKAPAKANGKVVGKVALPVAKGKAVSKPSAKPAKANKNKTSVAIKSGKGQGKAGRVKPRFSL